MKHRRARHRKKPSRIPAKKFFFTHSSRADNFTESVIREMTRLALKHDAINLAQGFPGFSLPARLKAAACEAVNDDINQYTITWGKRPPPRAGRSGSGNSTACIRSRKRDHGYLRVDRGDDGLDPCGHHPPVRRGDRPRAVLPELWPGCAYLRGPSRGLSP